MFWNFMLEQWNLQASFSNTKLNEELIPQLAVTTSVEKYHSWPCSQLKHKLWSPVPRLSGICDKPVSKLQSNAKPEELVILVVGAYISIEWLSPISSGRWPRLAQLRSQFLAWSSIGCYISDSLWQRIDKSFSNSHYGDDQSTRELSPFQQQPSHPKIV